MDIVNETIPDFKLSGHPILGDNFPEVGFPSLEKEGSETDDQMTERFRNANG